LARGAFAEESRCGGPSGEGSERGREGAGPEGEGERGRAWR
jgi:hypothetical protein